MSQKSFIVTGCLAEKELLKLRQSCVVFRSKASKSGLYTKGKGSINEEFRKSLTYFPKPSEFKYGCNLLQSLIITNYYDVHPNLNYDRISEIQYAIYEAGGKFKKHQDVVATDRQTVRCLTMSINLSNENEYDGGELVVFVDNHEITLSKVPGSFVIFPSFFFHEAREVLGGERESIVTWLHSPIDKLNKLKSSCAAKRNT
jgi:Rps23 Pro-64 3,4-dihydroxylase Tpa1-like proline 4-hydroxylase